MPLMQPGEKVTLLRRVAATLSGMTWTDMDLNLGEFGFPTDFWEGDAYEYALKQLREGTTDALVVLHRHLHPDADSEVSTRIATRQWSAEAFRLFISHTQANKDLAGQLKQILAAWLVDAFVAHDAIEPSREWQDEIESALQTCDGLTALLSDDFIQSKWCDQEVGFCVGRNIVIVPVMLAAEPHGFIGKYQAIRVRGPIRAAFIAGRIFETLVANELTRPRMARSVVERFALSGSFDNARENFRRLRLIEDEPWDVAMIERAESAAQENGQLREAGVPSDKPNEWTSLPNALEGLLAPIRERAGQGPGA
jgi:TIR domain